VNFGIFAILRNSLCLALLHDSLHMAHAEASAAKGAQRVQDNSNIDQLLQQRAFHRG
jgi:hypothetical protein